MAAWYSAESEGANALLSDPVAGHALTEGASVVADATKVSAAKKSVPSPAIWKASDADTSVYLFGTIHLLKEDVKWETAAFENIFNDASAIYLEADVGPEAQAKLGPIVQKHAFFQDGQTLSDVLGDQKEIVEAGAKTLGLPYERLDGVKPWFVGVQFGVKQIVDAGYQPGAGVEAVITAKAKSEGKTMRYFESAEEQLTILSSFPMDGQVRFLTRTAKDISEKGANQLDQLVRVWQAGDVAGIEAVGLQDMVLSTPEAYQKIIVNRNANWTVQLKELMDSEAGTFLVAVGALHLAGDDSVVHMLRAEGVEVVRQ
jgi:uncharacterized protein YbaP (TraB family)